MLLGWLWGAFVSRLVFRRRAPSTPLWLCAVIAAVTLSIPFSAVVVLAGVVAFHHRYRLADIPQVLATVTLISGVLITINILAERQGATAASDTPPKFLERLPLTLRGDAVWAVEAEDH